MTYDRLRVYQFTIYQFTVHITGGVLLEDPMNKAGDVSISPTLTPHITLCVMTPQVKSGGGVMTQIEK